MPMDVNVNVHVDFPALDKLVDMIGNKFSGKCECEKHENVNTSASVITMMADRIDEDETSNEENAESHVTACEADVTEEVKERVYTAEELANAAMRLRDADKENAKRIKAKYPELGIRSITDLKTNEAARKPFAEMLIALGAEI